MDSFDWVASAGGALICLESISANRWGGILRLTSIKFNVENDYERTFFLKTYIGDLQVGERRALILGEGSLETSFWCASDRTIFVVRIYACEPEMKEHDFERIMQSLDPHLFDDPREALDFDVVSSPLIMFDAANDGNNIGDKVVSVEIELGRYRVLTQPYDPDPSCSLVLHRFDRLAEKR